MTEWTTREDAFISPTVPQLTMAMSRTAEFLAESDNGSWVRKAHAMTQRTRLGARNCVMAGVDPYQAQQLIALGFKPISAFDTTSLFAGRIRTEQWIGPDGAIRLETAKAGQFFGVYFENGRKLAMTQDDRTGHNVATMQFEHEYLFRTGDLVRDYQRMVTAMLKYQDEHQTRALFRGTDVALSQRIDRYYDTHIVSLGYIASIYLPLLAIAAMLFHAFST